MKKKTIYERVYELCIEGIPAKRICEITRSDKGHISRVINALIDAGLLVCVNPRDRVRFYEATKKPFSMSIVSVGRVYQSTNGQKKNKKVEQGGCYIRCHAISYLSDVKSMGCVPWDKKWETDGVVHFLYKYPFENIGEISFHWIRGSNSNVLRINLPSIWWNSNDGDPNEFLRRVADQSGTWFMKRFKCDFRGLRQCGKGHFEIPVHDPSMVSLAQASSFRHGDFILDSSLGYPEFGSVGGYDPLAELLSLPKRVASLEKRMDRVEETLEHVVSVVEKMSVQINKIGEQVDHLTKLFDAPKRPDELRDVT